VVGQAASFYADPVDTLLGSKPAQPNRPRSWSERLERPLGCLAGLAVASSWAYFSGDYRSPLKSVDAYVLLYSLGQHVFLGLAPSRLRSRGLQAPSLVGIILDAGLRYLGFSLAAWLASIPLSFFPAELPFPVTYAGLLTAVVLLDAAAALLSAFC
jgi:hypothetical protein